MARSSSRTYDPKTGKWSTNKESENGSSKKTTTTTDKKSGDSTNLKATSTDPSSSKGSSEKKQNNIEYNTLTGTLNYIPTKETIKIKVGDTITIKGIGKYLSGKYYVQDITRNISSSGYTNSATVIKTDFGDSLKDATTKGKETTKESKKVESTAKSSNDSSKTHILKRGESLWSIAELYYKDGSKYNKIASANNVTTAQFTKLPIGKKLIIP